MIFVPHRQMRVREWINTLPEHERKPLMRMHETLTRIEYYWWDYPLAVAMSLSMLVWIGWFVYYEPAAPHTSAVFGLYSLGTVFVTTFFVSRMVVRALLSGICRQHIRDLQKQLQTTNGKRAWQILRRVDGTAIWTAKDAVQTSPHL